jgi:beta-glucosidase
MTRTARSTALLVALAVLGAGSAPATPAGAAGRCGSHPWCDTALSPETRADLLTGAMTAEEKAAFVGGDDVAGVAGGDGTHTGTQTGVPRLELPTIYYSDGPQGPRAGKATAMPGPMAIAAAWDRNVARQDGAEIGSEVRAKGNDVVFAPTINVMRTPYGGRTFEGYGEDPFLIGQTAAAWIEGAQSSGVIANVKHFAANNQEGIGAAPVGILGAAVVGNRLTVDARVDERTLREIYLPGFEAAVKQGGSGTVMCSYNKVNGQYACEQQHLIQDILEREWGFKGYVLSDYGAAHNTIASLNNGLDFEPFPGTTYAPQLVTAAVASGQVSAATLDGHVRRTLRTLFAFGAFDHPTVPYDDTKIDQAAHKAIAGSVAERAATLLRNEDAALPLDASRLKRIALVGADADTFKNRGGSAGITPFSVTTPREAITRRAGPGVQVTYDPGSDRAAAAAAAKGADVALVFASDSSIEGKDKTCLNLSCPTDAQAPMLSASTNDQDALIDAVAAANPRTVVVLETGGPVLTPWRKRVPAILEAWDPGEDGGNAIARVLFGDVDPAGRLPVTFPNSPDDLPTAGDPEKYPGVAETETYKEGVLVGYRWFDAKGLEPAFPFGAGLSYTTFQLSDLRVSAAGASVLVRNTGKRAGTQTVQAYVDIPSARAGVTQPPRQLKGFAKVELAAGTSKRVSVALDDRSFSFYDAQRSAWTVTPSCYVVEIGTSSRDIALRGTLPRGGGSCAAPSAASRARCSSRRAFEIRLPRGLRHPVVRVRGARVSTFRRNGRLRALVDLRRRGLGAVRVVVTGRSATGRPVRQLRRYRPCVRRAS